MRAELEALPGGAPSPAGATTPAAGTVPPSAAAPLDVLSLGAGAAARAAGRSLRRPVVWIALAIAVAVALWLVSRAGP
jgi:hypothetical protein